MFQICNPEGDTNFMCTLSEPRRHDIMPLFSAQSSRCKLSNYESWILRTNLADHSIDFLVEF